MARNSVRGSFGTNSRIAGWAEYRALRFRLLSTSMLLSQSLKIPCIVLNSG
jgi:hypothetical protein